LILDNDLIIDLIEKLEFKFKKDLGDLINKIEETEYDYDDKNNSIDLYNYNEYTDLFRKNIFPFNDIFENFSIKNIEIKNNKIILKDLTQETKEIEKDYLLKIKNINLKAFQKLLN
jgi:hypothetical protein